MLSQYTYLYVDDDLLSQKVMRTILLNVLGKAANITIFSDSSDFMSRVAVLNPKPNVILLDIHVKPCDGFEMLRLLRSDEHYAASKIIAVTASVMNEEIAKLRASGFDGTIGKPVSVRTLPTLLERILNGEQVWST